MHEYCFPLSALSPIWSGAVDRRTAVAFEFVEQPHKGPGSRLFDLEAGGTGLVKKPVAAADVVKRRPAAAVKRIGKPSAAVKQRPAANIPRITCPLRVCPVCEKRLFVSDDSENTKCVIIGSETIAVHACQRVKCGNGCKTTCRHNFFRLGGARKINCLSYNDIRSSGVYLLTPNFGFTTNFLELQYLRLIRTQEAPGQEAHVQRLFHNADENIMGQVSFRDHLLHALEGIAIAKRNPSEVVPFDIDFPASYLPRKQSVFLFPAPVLVDAISFDGHFGVNRVLEAVIDPPRTSAKIGKPRSLKPHQRTAQCSKKYFHVSGPDRTGGWQFVVDPVSRRCLGATEHLNNECCEDKHRVVEAVMAMENVDANLIIHDDACTFESYVKKRRPATYSGVKHFIVDEFHRCNHTCCKKCLTRAEKARMKGVPTTISEMFNSWIRRLNFFLNGLRPASHRFWVTEAITFYNANLKDMPIYHRKGRTNAEMRKRPASSSKA